MKHEILITSSASAEDNMATDVALLQSLDADPRCILRFYRWSHDSATYGYFIKPWDFLQEHGVHRRALHLARRPTGGGIIFHQCDLAFSLSIPESHPRFSANTLDNYALVNEMVMAALKYFVSDPSTLLEAEPPPADASCRHFCMAKPTKYDVMLAGRKVGGGAQRRTKHGFLHQGTLALTIPSTDFLEDVLLPGTCVAEAMRQNSYALLGANPTAQELDKARVELQSLLIEAFKSI